MKKLIIRIIVNAIAIINLKLIYNKILNDVIHIYIDNMIYFYLFTLPVIFITIILLMNKLINKLTYLNLTTNYCFLSFTIATIISIAWWMIKPPTKGFIDGLEEGFNIIFAICMLILILIIWITTYFYKRKNM